MELDLYQDMFIRCVSPLFDDGLMRELQEAGFEDGVGAPLALKRKLAVTPVKTDMGESTSVHATEVIAEAV